MNNLKLLEEVVLELISPTVYIIRFDLDHEGPVRLVFLITILIEFGKLHDRHSTGEVSNFSQMLANGLSGALVVHFLENVSPSVSEEVKRGLTIESEHAEPVSRSHTVSQELHAVTWGGLGHLGGGESELRDSHNSVLGTLENSSVGSIRSGDEFHESGGTNGMGSLNSTSWHGVRNSIKRQVHVLVEEALEFVTDKESFGSSILNDALPDHLLLTVGRLSLVLGGIEIVEMIEVGAMCACIMTSELLSLGLSSEGRGS